MASNLFLPEKKEIEIEHNLSSTGVFSWVAPDKNRDGSDYSIQLILYGGGAPKGNVTDGGGGCGGYILGNLIVSVGSTYNIHVGEDRSGFGQAGSDTHIDISGSEIVRSGGGAAGTIPGARAASGASTVTNATLFSTVEVLGTFGRDYNGSSGHYIYFTSNLFGGVGGRDNQSNVGVGGRAVLKYSLKENITDNTPT